MDYLERAKSIYEKMVEDRRYLHRHPEVGMELPETTAYVMKRLEEMGYEPVRMGEGVCASVCGNPNGKVFLLRADMDALPMKEDSGLPFASEKDCAHTCGHDMHTAMLLGAARMLKEREAELNGTVKLMFQPGEEVLLGAKSMIEAGILENPHVDAAMGAHMIPMIPVGVGGYGTGVVSASSDHLVIQIEGKGGHGAHPQTAVDPIQIGVHIHMALQELISREIDPAETAVLTFGKFHGGDAANIIPSSMIMEGTLRTFSEPLRAFLLERIKTISVSIAEAFRGKAVVSVPYSTCALTADESVAEAVAQGWREAGLTMIKRGDRMSGSEDFAEVAARVPSTFFVVGGGTAEDGCGYSLHNPKIRFREEALIYGAAAYAAGAEMWLKKQEEKTSM